MSIEIWLAFIAASILLLIIPGPTILTVISYSLSHGRQANSPLIAAVALADSTAMAMSLLGLGTILAASAFWFGVIKWIGGLYLIYLGIKLLLADVPSSHVTALRESGPRWKLFVNTYLVTALNPKGIVFFAAFLPQFINTNARVAPQLWILAITFIALSIINATLYVIFASSARRLLVSARVRRRFNFAGGSMLSAAGLWTLMSKRPT
ncbi:MAG: LysE family translocator [Cyanobacteria bacterium P01_D01_bin.128]